MLFNWTSLVRSALLRTRWQRRPRRRSFAPITVAAELLEHRQLLTAAVTAVAPNTSPTQGGAQVNILGSGFTNVTGVTFGNTAASSFQIVSPTLITVVCPAHAAGAVDVQVDSSDGNSPINPLFDQFNYLAGKPQVTGISPNSGSVDG